jgi:hypothetical protein
VREFLHHNHSFSSAGNGHLASRSQLQQRAARKRHDKSFFYPSSLVVFISFTFFFLSSFFRLFSSSSLLLSPTERFRFSLHLQVSTMGLSCCKCCGCCAAKKKCTEYSKGQEGFFVCDGKCGNSGSVWGSGPYTSDSSVCRAARHAGVIGERGGVFKVKQLPGQGSYESSTANGITTSSYGSYDQSMTISKF